MKHQRKSLSSSPPHLSNLKLAGFLLDIIPASLRMIRQELWESAQGELTVPQLRILSHVNRGLSTASELAELQGVSLPAISKMIQSLVKRELLRREFKEESRKQIFLYLTPKGKERFLKVRQSGQKKIALELDQCSTAERKAIHAGLEAIEILLGRRRFLKQGRR